MEDYQEEQDMEVEALQAILMDDIRELEDGKAGGLDTDARCFEITVSPMGDNEDEPTEIPVRLALIFAHTPKYPEEPPLLNVRSLQGIKGSDTDELKEKLLREAQENLGMAMMYTLATSAKEWLREKYNPEDGLEQEVEEEKKEEVIEAHGLPVTPETFLEWRDLYEAELALERAKLMPETMLALSTKEKRLSGRQWFESGRGLKGAKDYVEVEEEEDEEREDFDDDVDEEDIDEEDMLDHYLTERAEKT